MSTALLVIDAQVNFFEGNPPVFQAQAMMARIQGLIERARQAEVPVIYVQADDAPEFDGPIHPDIAPQPDEPVVLKYTPNSFHKTDLQAQLMARGITRLIVVGFQTELCIDTTCRRAWDLGYDVWLVKDAHSTFDFDDAVLTAEQTIAHHTHILDMFATIKAADEITFD